MRNSHEQRTSGAGNEFRGNDEVKAKFFNVDGSLKADMISQVLGDMTVLLNPSKARALALNKAYKAPGRRTGALRSAATPQ